MAEPTGSGEGYFSKESEDDIFEWEYVKRKGEGYAQAEYDEETRHWFYKIEPLVKQVRQ